MLPEYRRQVPQSIQYHAPPTALLMRVYVLTLHRTYREGPESVLQLWRGPAHRGTRQLPVAVSQYVRLVPRVPASLVAWYILFFPFIVHYRYRIELAALPVERQDS